MEGSKRIKPATVFIYALALAALGGSGYLVYDRTRRKKADTQGGTRHINASKTSLTAKGNTLVSPRLLKKGSSGPLQHVLAKGGTGGKFGKGLLTALKKAGHPGTIDENTFNKITGPGLKTVKIIFNPGNIAAKLYRAAQSKNVDSVVTHLERIKNISDYTAVNGYYKKQGFIISKTIVTDLLDFAFKGNESAKDRLRNEFSRIGLKEDYTGKWSLQGIPLFKDLTTLRETFVIDAKNNRIPVKSNTILGYGIKAQNGMTWFRSVDNSILRVPTHDVKFTP